MARYKRQAGQYYTIKQNFDRYPMENLVQFMITRYYRRAMIFILQV